MQGPMSHCHPSPQHQFFILGLRLLVANRPGKPTEWRISLEDPHTSERSGFRTLAELNAFLQAWMDERTRGDP